MSWNVFFLLSALLFLGLLVSGQGQELLRMRTEHAPGTLGDLNLAIALLLYAVLTTLASVTVAHAGTHQLEVLADAFAIEASTLLRLSRALVPPVIGVLPIITLATLTREPRWFVGIVLYLAATIAVVWRIKSISPISRARARPLRRPARRALMAITAGLMVLTIVASASVALSAPLARTFGTVGVTLSALAFWASLLSLTFVAVPLALRWPNLALLVPILWLVASLISDPNEFPRRPAASPSASKPMTGRTSGVLEMFAEWLVQFEHDDSRALIPVFLVSAEGGGLRAAYWTGRTLAELNERTLGRFSRHTFAYSGVSGGSLGIAAFLDAVYLQKTWPPTATRHLEEFLGRDYLAPLAGRLLITEPLWQIAGRWSGVTPRDVAFETQWSRDWHELTGSAFFRESFLDRFSVLPGRPRPAVIFNATNVETGKRVLLTNIDVAVSANDFLQPLAADGVRDTIRDMTVAEAVHLSARFPYVSPPASLRAVVPTGTGKPPVERLWGRVVDGGYFDNSGGLIIRDLFEGLTQMRAFAQRGDDISSSQPHFSWQRIRRLAERVVLHIVVIRNDPFATSVGERNAFPSLWAGHIRDLWGDAATQAWRDGAYATSTPSRSVLGELLGPPQTMIATREARGMATRRTLWETVSRSAQDQRYQCELALRAQRSDPGTRSLGTSRECLERSYDEYSEISLGEMLGDRPAADEPPAWGSCIKEDRIPSIALGWVLSGASRTTMSCLAGVNEAVQRIARSLLETRVAGLGAAPKVTDGEATRGRAVPQ